MSVASATQEDGGTAGAQRSVGQRVARSREGSIRQAAEKRAPVLQSMFELRRLVGASGPNRDAIVNLVRCYVLAHSRRPIEIAEVVAVTGIIESTLRRAVEAEAGAHLVQFITDIKLGKARALLSTNRGSRSVSEIAAVLGFVSANAFGRSYRRRFGESATETRKRAIGLVELSLDTGKSNPCVFP